MPSNYNLSSPHTPPFMPLPTVPKGKAHVRPPTRAIESIHKKFGGTSHPHVSHTSQDTRRKKRVWVKAYTSKSGKYVKGHYVHRVVKN